MSATCGRLRHGFLFLLNFRPQPGQSSDFVAEAFNRLPDHRTFAQVKGLPGCVSQF